MKSKGKSDRGDKGGAAFKIEKGIAIPAKVVMGSLSPASRAMLELTVGDSFLISDKSADTVMGGVRAMNKRMKKTKDGKEFTARRVTDGVRVWRVK
jgi:hypothetical protein